MTRSQLLAQYSKLYVEQNIRLLLYGEGHLYKEHWQFGKEKLERIHILLNDF